MLIKKQPSTDQLIDLKNNVKGIVLKPAWDAEQLQRTLNALQTNSCYSFTKGRSSKQFSILTLILPIFFLSKRLSYAYKIYTLRQRNYQDIHAQLRFQKQNKLFKVIQNTTTCKCAAILHNHS